MFFYYRIKIILIIALFSPVILSGQQNKLAKLDDHFNEYEVIQINTKEWMAKISQNTRASFQISLLGWDLTLENSGIMDNRYECVSFDGQKTQKQPASHAKPMNGYTSQGGRVSLTINDDFIQGFIQAGMFTYYIEPVSHFDKETKKGQFVFYNVKDIKPGKEMKCGIKENHRVSNKLIEKNINTRAGGCYQIDYAVACDYSMFTAYSSSLTAVQNQIIAVTNDMQTNYDDEFADAIQFVIVQQFIVTASGGDPWTASTSSSALLNSFTSWGPTGFSATHDVASLWSKRDFDGASVSTVGLAWLSVVCTSNRYNVLQDYTSIANSKRVLLAHELGHNFGSSHDASGSTTVMAPSVQNTITWSSNSISSIQNHYLSRNCLANCTVGPPQISFIKPSTSTSEYAGTGSTGICNQPFKTLYIPVEMNKASTNAVNVSVNISAGGSAVAGRDFIVVNNQLVFPSGIKSTQIVELRIIDDAIDELTESFVLQLSITSGSAVFGSNSSHSISIADFDAATSVCCSPGDYVTYGSNAGATNLIFWGDWEDSKNRVLFLPSHLQAAGLTPGLITSIQYFVYQKNSTQPYQNFRIGMENVSQTTLLNMPWVPTEEVFSGTISTIGNQWNEITFAKPFYWNGTSSLYFEFCYDNLSYTGNDFLSFSNPVGGVGGRYIEALIYDGLSGCNVTSENANFVNYSNFNVQPYFKFKQLNTLKTESTLNSSSKSEIKVGEKANFYSSNGKIIAGIKNLGSTDINCIEVLVETSGTGKPALPMGGGDHTAKTIKITASPNALYEVTLYYTQNELNTFGTNANKLNIIKTQSTLATSTMANSIISLPDLVVSGIGADVAYAYSGVFTGFSRFALTNRKIDGGASVDGGDLVIAEQGKGIIFSNKSGNNFKLTVNSSGNITSLPMVNPSPKAIINATNLTLSTAEKKLILKSSPDGIYRMISVSDTGVLSTSIVSLPAIRAQLTTGDLALEKGGSAIILKSPNNQCWRIFVDENGSFKTTNILCP